MERDVLERFAVDLTAQARAGEIDPVIGREDEIRQLVDILSRRRQNNPLLVGEAGVGKTAVVEGFALAAAQRELPRHLEQVRVLALDLGLLQAGATLEGEFEERLASVIDAARAAEPRVILFLDEVHMLVGAGGAAGTGDAANLLKPALARGEVSVIAATTWREFKVHIEPDPALTRRFETVVVAEPRREAAVAILRGVARGLERHHGVEVRDEAVIAAVDLSTRHLSGRRLPDKAISLLDTACAQLRVAHEGTPAAVERAARRITWIDQERVALAREAEHHPEDPSCVPNSASARRLELLAREAELAESELELLEARWQRERALVRKIRAVREELGRGDRNRSPGADQHPAPAPHLRRRLADLEAALASAQAGAEPLVPLDVDRRVVAEVVQAWTGIPVARQGRDDAEIVSRLEERLAAQVVGQRAALELLGKRLRTARAGLDAPGRPLGVFLLSGPSGVGKTHTAHALAELLFGGAESLITLDMAEYREAHTLSKLRGAPPGYVGHGRGGHLTEAVRRRPYSVILLDDLERAHPDVVAAFLPVFDRGRMEDGEGTLVDFGHTLILMTSRLAPHELASRLGRQLVDRAVHLPFAPLDGDAMAQMLERELEALVERLRQRRELELGIEAGLVARLAAELVEDPLAGRAVQRLLGEEIVPAVAASLLTSELASESAPAALTLGLDEEGRPRVEAVAFSDPRPGPPRT